MSRSALSQLASPSTLCPAGRTAMVHLASGVGNIVLATPLLCALSAHGYFIDVLIDGDYMGTGDLLRDWSALRTVFDGKRDAQYGGRYDRVIPAIPPFYWHRYARIYAGCNNVVPRPPDELFYRDEQAYYLEFAKAVGCEATSPLYYFLPIPPAQAQDVTSSTLVLAPGCKTGEMAAKRWPYFSELAEVFANVAVVGTLDDLNRFDGAPIRYPGHVRMLAGTLSLRETAAVMAAAGAVVANDSGLGHVAGAVGTPTILLFGPTPDGTLGRFPPNVTTLRAGLPCEPCWFGARFHACRKSVDCLARLPLQSVADEVRRHLHAFRGAQGASS